MLSINQWIEEIGVVVYDARDHHVDVPSTVELEIEIVLDLIAMVYASHDGRR